MRPAIVRRGFAQLERLLHERGAELCNRRLDHRHRHDPCAIFDACIGAVGRTRSVQLCKIIHAIRLPRPPAPSVLLGRRL
eukprot:6998022-Prymnesium_polylepis.2